MGEEMTDVAAIIVMGVFGIAAIIGILFGGLIHRAVACSQIRKMAMVLPEKDRERWIEEQMIGLLAASSGTKR